MATVFKTLALIVLLAALGYGGFYAGQYLRHVSPQNIPAITATDLIPKAKPIQAADKPYAVKATVGPLSRSVALSTFSAGDDGLYAGHLPAADADGVSRGQSVVFYDRADAILPVVGYIESAPVIDGDVARIQFTLDTGVDEYGTPRPAPDLNGARARIVTIDMVVKRLPLGALFQDTEGNMYVWKAVSDGQSAYHILHQRVFVGITGDAYFEVGPEIGLDDLVIANPPDGIENGQTLDILVRHIDAPLHGYARQAEIRRNDNAARQAYLDLAAFQAATTPGGLGACAANISAEGLPSEILSINSPLNAPAIAGPSASGASGGCSSCSSAAAPAVTTPAPSDGENVDTAPEAQATPVPAPTTAPAPTGGCGGCGGGTYGGDAPAPITPDGPATTQ